MIRAGLMVLVMLACISARGQVLISMEFTSDDDNKPIRENDSCKCYVATGDTAHTACIYEEPPYYKLYTRSQKLIAEGAYSVEKDKYLQEGRWIARFESGKVKRTGYFIHGLPIGTWEEYYSSGKLKAVRNYGVFDDEGVIMSCLSGSCQEYYQNGNLKTSGFYVAVMGNSYDTLIVNDPITGQNVQKLISHKKLHPEKMPQWETYTENGELEKKDEPRD